MAKASIKIRAHRIFETTIGAAGVGPQTLAVGSLTEIDVNGNPFTAGATMKVYNVAPVINGFVVRGEVDWDSDLDIRVTVLFE